MRLPWTKATPRLPFGEPWQAGNNRLPEPNWALIDFMASGYPKDAQRVREELHARWHADNPTRPCERPA